MLDKAGLVRANPSDVPLPSGMVFSATEGDLLYDTEKYRRLVGKLLYLNYT